MDKCPFLMSLPVRLWGPVLAVAALAGCGDPLRDVERLSAVDIAVAEAANIAVDPAADEGQTLGGPGFLGRLFGGQGRAGPSEGAPGEGAGPPEVPGDPALSADIVDLPEGAAEAAPEVSEELAMAPSAVVTSDAAPARRGLLGLFGARGRSAEVDAGEGVAPAASEQSLPPDVVTDPEGAEAPAQGGDEVTLAAAAPPSDAAEQSQEQSPERRGLFGRIREARAEAPPVPTGPDAIRVPEGMAVPYGSVGTNCAVSRRDLGDRIARQSGFEIWDTARGTTAPRTHYITGFPDNCARQFTGALVLMGDVGTHEIVRYSDVNLDQPWSDVDNAYEDIKSRVCRVGRRQPCGSRLEALGQDTAFVTVYETFGSGPEWVEILLHDGRVVAVATERP